MYDAYYTTSYIEATVPPNQTDSNSYQLQGWIQVGSYSYNSNVDSCGPVISYGTWDYSPTVIDTHTATTTIQKRSFEGSMLWSNTVEGYYSGKSPLIFDGNGNLYAFTVDYKGLKMRVRIGNNDYELKDPNRPAFYLTDSVMAKDYIHEYVVSRINSDDGGVTWQKKNLFEHYYEESLYFVNGMVSGNNIWVCSWDGLYKLDMAGNFIAKLPLLGGDCLGQRINRAVYSSLDGNIFVHTDGIPMAGVNTDKLAKMDVNGNLIWVKDGSYLFAFSQFQSTASGGFINHKRLYDNAGNLVKNIDLKAIINQNGFTFGNAMNEEEVYDVSCNTDLVCSKSNQTTNKTWLIRTNSNGDL